MSFLEDVDALELVPAILRQYASHLKLDLSNLQILDFVDKDVLELAEREIMKHKGGVRVLVASHAYKAHFGHEELPGGAHALQIAASAGARCICHAS